MTNPLMTKKRIFVTGATGQAGSAIVRSLLRVGQNIEIVGTHYSQEGFFLDDPRVRYVPTDLRNSEDTAKAAKDCDWAVMAAAVTGGAVQAGTEPWRQVTDNVIIDAQTFESLSRVGVKRVVYVGSASVYPDLKGYIREQDLDWNLDPHPAHFGVGWVKRCAEKLAQFWHDKNGMDVIIGRASNIYGPGAKFNPSTSHFIPALIRKAVQLDDPYEIFGNPEVVRDVIYADDFGDAVANLLLNEDVIFDIFNIGSQAEVTVGQVADLCLKHAGHQPREIRHVGKQGAVVEFRALDCSKLRDVLHWNPSIDIDEGIRRTMDWWRENQEWWKR